MVQKFFFPKFNQIWCVSYLHQWHMHQDNYFGRHTLGPWGGGRKVKYHKISITKSISKIFKPNVVCLLTNEDIKHIRQDFHLVPWDMAQGWDLGVPWGVWGSKNFFSQIQPDLMRELLTSMTHATVQFLDPRLLGP